MDVSLRMEYAETNDLAGQSNILSHLIYDMDVADCPEEPTSVLSNNESERLLDSCSWNRYRMADVIKENVRRERLVSKSQL